MSRYCGRYTFKKRRSAMRRIHLPLASLRKSYVLTYIGTSEFVSRRGICKRRISRRIYESCMYISWYRN